MPDDKFTIVLKRSPEYKIYPGNVVYGGATPDGAGILMNICVDHAAFPSYIQHSIVEGKVDISRIDDQAVMGNLERELLCGISMSTAQAKQLAGWLTALINKIEEQSHE